MKRRQLLALGSMAAVSWSLAAWSQQPNRLPRVSVLMGGLSEGDPAGRAELAAFEGELTSLGWAAGRNLLLETRWPGADLVRIRESARNITETSPDLVLSRATLATRTLLQEAPLLPVVFVLVAEPVESGVVQSLARPGGHVTGFSNFDGSIGAKLLELLKGASPSLTRVAVLYNPQTAPFGTIFVRSVQSAANTLEVVVVPSPVSDDIGLENTIAAMALSPGGGFIAITDSFLSDRRELIVELAARHRVPAVYANRSFTPSGGLIALAADYPDLFRRAASYVDRILKGVKPGDLPVQHPTKFELSINMKTARSLGLEIPQSLLARADEVIE